MSFCDLFSWEDGGFGKVIKEGNGQMSVEMGYQFLDLVSTKLDGDSLE